ncbi:hypothetical protein BSZ14_03920 [Sphingomonas sp. Sph1(2015)]|nr:hypothetical protein BSZ14_03920 [Sphingomonas sp. Sph1(2015)]
MLRLDRRGDTHAQPASLAYAQRPCGRARATPRGLAGDHGRGVPKLSCPPLSGPSTMTVWTKEGTTNACQEAQARGNHREAARG